MVVKDTTFLSSECDVFSKKKPKKQGRAVRSKIRKVKSSKKVPLSKLQKKTKTKKSNFNADRLDLD